MSLTAGCPRCPTPVSATDGRWTCPAHGEITPLWRPHEASYDAFAEHLLAADGFPTFLPWPLSPGWSVTDFGVVEESPGPAPGRILATVTCCSGTSELDGPVDLFVVTEEAGTGVGSRCAGTIRDDPGPEVGEGRPAARVRIGSQPVPLWAVSTSETHGEFDRSAFAGEAGGRWLWIVLRPASAMLLLREDWILRDVSGVGPPLVELSFGGHPPSW